MLNLCLRVRGGFFVCCRLKEWCLSWKQKQWTSATMAINSSSWIFFRSLIILSLLSLLPVSLCYDHDCKHCIFILLEAKASSSKSDAKPHIELWNRIRRVAINAWVRWRFELAKSIHTLNLRVLHMYYVCVNVRVTTYTERNGPASVPLFRSRFSSKQRPPVVACIIFSF